MPDRVFCPRLDADGWVSNPVTGAPRHRQPPTEHHVACTSCGAMVAQSNPAQGDPVCENHLDDDEWLDALRTT